MKTLILIVIFPALAIFACKSSLPTNKNTEREDITLKIRDCPDAWYVNKMPSINDQPPTEYMVYKGSRREISEFDLDWIRKNCAQKSPEPVY